MLSRDVCGNCDPLLRKLCPFIEDRVRAAKSALFAANGRDEVVQAAEDLRAAVRNREKFRQVCASRREQFAPRPTLH